MIFSQENVFNGLYLQFWSSYVVFLLLYKVRVSILFIDGIYVSGGGIFFKVGGQVHVKHHGKFFH